MRVAVGCFAQESHSFSPVPGSWSHFGLQELTRGPAMFERFAGTRTEMAGVLDVARERGIELVPLLAARASSSAGPLLRDVFEAIADELLNRLRQAGAVDGVLLVLHGAMVAEGYDDCEGDILTHARVLVGPDVPVGAELDLHCHVTARMVEQATALVGYKEYPHVDVMDRMLDLFAILADTAEGKVDPVVSTFDCRMIGLFPTTAEPMRSFVDEFTALEGQEGILNVWLGHGFPYGDVPDLGATMVVVTDGDAARGAREVAQRAIRQARDAGRSGTNRRDRTRPRNRRPSHRRAQHSPRLERGDPAGANASLRGVGGGLISRGNPRRVRRARS